MIPYYQRSIQDSLAQVDSSLQGLSEQQAHHRLQLYGKNIIKEEQEQTVFQIFLHQLQSPLVIILIVAGIISGAIGEYIDAVIIILIVIVNAVFGCIQEYKADKAIQSLKKMSGLKSKVIRDGTIHSIDASSLTIGDIMILDTGDHISADARLIESINLESQESLLTGESVPVPKHIHPIQHAGSVGDMYNMVFRGTTVSTGRGKAVVTAIGMKSQLGTIAQMIQDVPEKQTNLEQKLGELSKQLGIITIITCIIIFLIYVGIRGLGLHDSFLTAITLAVAAIPEGLPAVVTISLGLGVTRFISHHVLVRRLSSVETLGAVDVICSDKTGTLTKNQMTVTTLFVNQSVIKVSGTGYTLTGGFSQDPKICRSLLEIGVLCNTSSLDQGEVIGDPTEAALIVSAHKGGVTRSSLALTHTRQGEIPFDSDRKMMSSIYTHSGETWIYSKGAIEHILPRCNRILIHQELRELDDTSRQEIIQQAESFARQALRVLGFAYAAGDSEQNLIFVGIQAMIDPARDEVKDALIQCRSAGIRTIMITGDNLITATAIADSIGIRGIAITGEEFQQATNKSELIKQIGVFARVNPSDKQTIVQLLQSQGHIVAMTGDGVNDAPALKMADIGVGMGISGTDVSKEAADMVLTDDHFASIVHAIQEGRGIYDNIQKFVTYLLASNAAEIMILLVASIMGLPLPLVAIHLLRINLVTDGLPAIALGIDPINPTVMSQAPRSPSQGILNKQLIINIIVSALIMTSGALYLFIQHYQDDVVMARSGVFVLLVGAELIRLQIIRSQYGLGIFSNKRLIAAVATSILSVLIMIYQPLLSVLFEVKPLNIAMRRDIAIILLIMIGVSLGIIRTGFLGHSYKEYGKHTRQS